MLGDAARLAGLIPVARLGPAGLARWEALKLDAALQAMLRREPAWARAVRPHLVLAAPLVACLREVAG